MAKLFSILKPVQQGIAREISTVNEQVTGLLDKFTQENALAQKGLIVAWTALGGRAESIFVHNVNDELWFHYLDEVRVRFLANLIHLLPAELRDSFDCEYERRKSERQAASNKPE